MTQLSKYISQHGTVIEIGYFYGSGEEEVVSSLEEEGSKLTIRTTQSFYELTIKPGDYLLTTDGTARIVKSKHDIIDE